ncbi:hypothetical protein [Streptomyces sp. NPDC055709]
MGEVSHDPAGPVGERVAGGRFPRGLPLVRPDIVPRPDFMTLAGAGRLALLQ